MPYDILYGVISGDSIALNYLNVMLSFPRFLSERETADRNFALGYYLRENKVQNPQIYKMHLKFFMMFIEKNFVVFKLLEKI